MNRDPRSRAWLWPLGLTLLGFAIRLIYGMWIHPVGAYLYSDMEGAYNNALRFADPHRVFDRWDIVKPRAMGFLGGFFVRDFPGHALVVWGAFQVLLSTATLPLVYLGTRRFFGRPAALLALGFMAVSYLPVGFAAFLMVETYLMFFLALAYALLRPEHPLSCLGAGLALGVGCLFKPQGATIVPLWCLALLLWPLRGTIKRSLATNLFAPQRISAVLLGVGVLAALLPETIAVSKINGKPVLLSAYGGQNFYIGHCHVKLMAMDGGREGMFFAGIPKIYQRDEPWPDVTFRVSVFDSAFYVDEGMKCFRKSFWASVLWTLEQLGDVFAGWPGSTIDVWPLPGGLWSTTRFFNLVLTYLFAPLAFATLWRRRRDLGTWLGFGFPMFSIWGLAIIFSGDPRYREPFDLFIVAGGSFTAITLLQKLWARLGPALARKLLERASLADRARLGAVGE